MELVRQVAGAQLLFPAAAVCVVLVCAALVFALGFRTRPEPSLQDLPLAHADRKHAKKRKPKDKKSSPNRSSSDDNKKTSSPESKKSAVKEKKEEKVKEVSEKPKPKEKLIEPKVKKEQNAESKRGKKAKGAVDEEKPVDFDDGDWEEVPKKEKKKPKPEDKKESPIKKGKKKTKEPEIELKDAKESTDDEPESVEQTFKGKPTKDEVNRELREKINELQRVLKEAELRDNAASMPKPKPAVVEPTHVEPAHADEALVESELIETVDEPVLAEPTQELTEHKDKKKKDKKEKKNKAGDVAVDDDAKSSEKENIPESAPENEDKPSAAVFDELGDTWAEAKAPKKGKKKVRKDQ